MKVVISGYGRMGHMIEAELRRQGIEIAAISEDIQQIDPAIAREAVCIDFTVPDAILRNYRFLAEHFRAVVIGTTGWDSVREEVFRAFREAGTTLIYASNFSLGVNVLFAATAQVARLLADSGEYMPYIEEKHHCHKLDRPSGTAKTLASLVEEEMHQTPDVAAIRCGEIAGIHEVGFESTVDRLTLRHEAFSREGFAKGAVLAARKADQLQGIYEFKDCIL